MPEIKNAGSVIIKYNMRSVPPGLGSVSGLWARCYVTEWESEQTGRHSESIASKAMTRRKALDYIEKNGFELLLRNEDGEVYGTPDGTFRDYCREHKLAPAEDMGYATVFDKED